MTQLIRGRDNWDCTICCFAMAFDIPYDEVKAMFPRCEDLRTTYPFYRGVYDEELVLAALKLGYALVPWTSYPDGEFFVNSDAQSVYLEHRGLWRLGDHMIYFDGTATYDPKGPILFEHLPTPEIAWMIFKIKEEDNG